MEKGSIIPEKFTAKQASELCRSKEEPIDNILNEIKNRAGHGGRYIMVDDLRENALIELINLGYAISKHENAFGVEQTKIKWL